MVRKPRINIIFSLIFLVLLSGPAHAVFDPDSSPEAFEYMPGEILIMLKPEGGTLSLSSNNVSVSSPTLDELNEKYNVYKIEPLIKPPAPPSGRMGTFTARELPGIMRIYKVSFPEEFAVLQVVADYSNDPSVEFAEPNGIYELAITPNDPKYIFDTVYNSQWGPQKMKLTEMGAPDSGWNWSRGGHEVKVCILDTGVDYNHPDIKDNIWVNPGEDYNGDGYFDFRPTLEGGDLNGVDDDGNGHIDDIAGWDFVSVGEGSVAPGEDAAPRDNDPMDVHGHGTHCSGIASGVTDNGIGIAGVGWSCKIMAVRIGWKAPNGRGYMTWEDIIDGVYYAASNEADVLSMSFGGSSGSDAMAVALAYAQSNGVTLIAAAGNTGQTGPHYPAYYGNVMAVAATDINDLRASFSTYGSWVDVAAPGSYIYSSLPNNRYASWSGTSMACPHVAGLAGLIKHRFPSYTPTNIKTLIINSSDTISTSWDPGIRVNAYNALAPSEFGCPIILRDIDSGNSSYSNFPVISVEAIPVLGEPDQMMISLEASFAGASWEAYESPVFFSVLTGDGVKKVYFKSKKGSDVSDVEEASIILDTTSPEAISISLADVTSGSSKITNERVVSVEVSAWDLHQVVDMMVSEDASFIGTAWEPYTESFETELGPSLGTKEVYFRVRDVAGNISNIASTEIAYNPWALEMSGISVFDGTSGDQTYSNDRVISVEAYDVVGSFESLSMAISEESISNGALWIPYYNPASFEITSPGDGTKNIYYQLKDALRGFTTEVYADSIILDTTLPAVATAEPPNTGLNVSINQRIRIEFNDVMITETVTVAVYPGLTLGSADWTNGNRTLTYYPPDKLDFNTSYVITVEGQDKATNYLSPYAWNFTTEPPCSITGRITSDETHGIPDISVEVYIEGEFFGVDTTDSSGNYDIQNLPAGNFVAEPVVPGYEIKTFRGTLTFGENKDNVDVVVSREAWPQFHCDRYKTGVSPDSTISSNLKQQWKYETGATNTFANRNAPVAAYGKVYIGMSDGKIYCLNANDGSLVWSYQGSGQMMMTLTVADGYAYAFSGTGHLYCFYADTGVLKWHRYYAREYSTYNYLWSSPTFAGGNIYVFGRNSRQNYLYCFNAYTGALNWRALARPTWGAVTVKAGTIYLAAYQRSLDAYDSKDGALLWRIVPPTSGYYWRSSPVIAGNTAYIAGNEGYTYSIDLGTQTFNWNTQVSTVMDCSPLLKDNNYYCIPGTAYSSLYSLNASDGSINWSKSILGTGRGSAAYANGLVFAPGGKYVNAFDAETGTLLWSYEHTTNVYYSTPAVADGMLFIADVDGNILAFGENKPPNNPSGLAQYHFGTSTTLPAGGEANFGRVLLEMVISDPDFHGVIYPEIEIKPLSVPFEGTPNVSGESYEHTTLEVTTLVTLEGLANHTDYHWQVRVKDETGAISDWVTFNGGDHAFTVNDTTSPEIISTDPVPGETAVSTFSKISFTFNEPMDDLSVEGALNIYPATPGIIRSSTENATFETFELEPDPLLIGERTYTVTIDSTAADESGNYMQYPFTFTFETRGVGIIEGQVNLSGGGGLAGVLIEVSTSEITKATGTTNSSGYYIIENIPSGFYTLQARRQGHSISTRYDVQVITNTTTTRNFTLSKAWPMCLSEKNNSQTNPNAGLTPPLTLKWEYFTGKNLDTGVAIDDGKVFTATETDNLYALDLLTGTQLWTYNIGGSYTGPSVMDGIVYAAGSNLYALDASSGGLVWSDGTGGDTLGSIINNGILYIGSGKFLAAYDLEDQSLKWSYDAGINLYYSAPCIYGDHAYFIAGTVLKALDLEDRSLKWQYDLGGNAGKESSPCVHDDIVYACGSDGNVIAFDHLTGSIIWTTIITGQIFNSPLVTQDRVYVAGSTVLYALNRSNGATVWMKDVGQNIQSSPLLIDGVIYTGGSYGGSNDKVLAIDPSNGDILWSYQTEGGIWGTLAAADGILIAPCEDGYIRAFYSSSPPSISVLLDGQNVKDGDVINSRPDIVATITDNASVDSSSIELYFDGATIEGTTIITIEADRTYEMRYTTTAPLAPESVTGHTITVTARDEEGSLAKWERTNLRVIGGKVSIVGAPLNYPAVFKALSGSPVTFAYTLSRDADIEFQMFDLSGRIILTKKFGSGRDGGKAGYNSFDWNGVMDPGGRVGNGIYIYKIISGNRELGKGKLVVFD